KGSGIAICCWGSVGFARDCGARSLTRPAGAARPDQEPDSVLARLVTAAVTRLDARVGRGLANCCRSSATCCVPSGCKRIDPVAEVMLPNRARPRARTTPSHILRTHASASRPRALPQPRLPLDRQRDATHVRAALVP